jgi:hypothetical protein
MDYYFRKRISLGNGLFLTLSKESTLGVVHHAITTQHSTRAITDISPIPGTAILPTARHRNRRRRDRAHCTRPSSTHLQACGIGALMLAAFFWVLSQML